MLRLTRLCLTARYTNLNSTNVGVEYPLGKITISFSGYALPAASATAALAALAPTKIRRWFFRTVERLDGCGTQQRGTARPLMLARGAVGNFIYNLNGAGLNFVFTSTGTVTPPGTAAISATLGLSGGSTVLGGGSLPLAGGVTNSASSGSDPLNWSSAFPGIVSISPNTGSALAAGSSSSVTGTITAGATFLGPWVNTVTFTGTDATTSGAATGSPQTATINWNVIGKGTTNGTPGTVGVYGTQLVTQGGSLASGYNMAGLTSTLGSGATSFGIGQTTATILQGTLGASSTGIGMAWRSRTAAESVGVSNPPLISDVVNLTGITGGASSPYALQMTYDPSLLSPSTTAALLAGGYIHLAYNNGGTWTNAVFGDTGGSMSSTPTFVGTYAQYTASVGGGYTLAGAFGAWGVDTADNAVWAVINHDAEFGVAPEPGTLALLASGAGALYLAHRRRRKLAKAQQAA